MKENPRRKREKCNSYYEKLLANQPQPEEGETDDRARAIRYAKEHYECFYEVRDIERIIQWLDDASNQKERLNNYRTANHLVP